MKTILWIILLGYVGYQAYDFYALRQEPVYQAYVAFATALLDQDELTIKHYASPDLLRELSVNKKWLISMPSPSKRRFIYYRLLARESLDAQTERLRIRRTLRYDPEGTHSFYGKASLTDLHTVLLKDGQEGWKVLCFEQS